MAENTELNMLNVIVDAFIEAHGLYDTIKLLLESNFSIHDLVDTLQFDKDYVLQVATDLGIYKGEN